MQEAFERAARNNPKSEIVRQASEAAYNMRVEKRQKDEFNRMDGVFRTLGRAWKDYELYFKKTPERKQDLERLTESWQKVGATQFLVDMELDGKKQLINAFTQGAGIEERNIRHVFFDSAFNVIGDHTTRDLRSSLFGGARFTIASQILIKSFEDVLGYDKDKKNALLDFMYNQPDLKGQIPVAFTIPVLARWFQPPSNTK